MSSSSSSRSPASLTPNPPLRASSQPSSPAATDSSCSALPFSVIERPSQSDIRLAPPSSTPRLYRASVDPSRHSHSRLDHALLYELSSCQRHHRVSRFLECLLPLPVPLPQTPPTFYDAVVRQWTGRPGTSLETVFGPFVERLATNIVASAPPRSSPPSTTTPRLFHYYISQLPFTGGTRAARRADFYVSRRPRNIEGKPPDWSEVVVIGELSKPSKSDDKVLVQLGGYAREVFVAQPGRRFVPAFYLHGDRMVLYHFDRAGVITTNEPFNMQMEWDRFVHVILAYAFLPDDRLGLDWTITADESSARRTIRVFGARALTGPGEVSRYNLDKVLYTRPSVMGRATACWTASCGTNGVEYVIKDSWRQDGQSTEEHMYRLAMERGVDGLAILDAAIDVTCAGGELDDIHAIRGSLLSGTEKDKDDSNPRRKKRRKQALREEEMVTNRIHTRLVLRSAVGIRITDPHRTALEFLEAIRDAILCARDLFTRARIIHRDISPDNVLYTTDFTALTGNVRRKAFLIDLDYAIHMDHPSSGASHLTGKSAYLALTVATGAPNSLRSDMESFFYVMCTTMSEPTDDDTAREHPLANWHGVTVESSIATKQFQVGSTQLFRDGVLRHLVSRFKPFAGLLQDLRKTVTSTGLFYPIGEEFSDAMALMERPGSDGHQARLDFLTKENLAGLKLANAMIERLDQCLDEQR